MNRPPPEFSAFSPAEQQAAEWLVRHDRGMTPPEKKEFSAWLAESSEHERIFEELQHTWVRIGDS